MSERILIKKYNNRRLYSVNGKGFVTLDDIAGLIREGDEIKIIDAQTGEDVTKIILIQIILESEENKSVEYPLSNTFLQMIIKHGYKMAMEFFEHYFLIMVQPYLSFEEGMRQNLREWQKIDGGSSIWKNPIIPERKISSQFSPKPAGKEGGMRRNRESDQHSDLPHSLEIESLNEKVRELEEKMRHIVSRNEVKNDKKRSIEKSRCPKVSIFPTTT